MMDELTGLSNRRHFISRLSDEVERAHRSTRPLALAVIDVDNFKHVNDTHGHAAGDTVLHEIALVAQQSVRKNDLVGRIGGEEFAIMMTGIEYEEAENVAERIRVAIERHCFAVSGVSVCVTISAGVAMALRGEPVSELMSRADAALYSAKHAGRNRIKLAA